MAITWTVSEADEKRIEACADRAMKMLPQADRLSLVMDMTATHANGCPLDFNRLLDFDQSSFLHDICGINAHIDRKTGALTGCFVPRCARHEAVAP